MQEEQLVLNRIQRRNVMGASFEWKIVVDRRKFTSGHCTIGGEEKYSNNHGRPSDGLREKHKHGRRYGRISLAFGNG